MVQVFHSPGGSGLGTLLSCGHDDWASLILGFRLVLGWWGSGRGRGARGGLGFAEQTKKFIL